MKIITSILFTFYSLLAYGQPVERREADSLLRVLANTKDITSRIRLSNRLAQFHIFKPGENQIDFDSAVTYLNEARRLNKTVQSPSLAGQLLLTESYMIREKGEKNAAMKKVEEAIRILEAGDDKYYSGKALYELSGYYDYNNPEEYPKKLSLVERSVTAFEKSGDTLQLAEALKMLGDLYSQGGNYDKALEILHRALDAYTSVHHRPLQGVYNLLGGIYAVRNDYKQGLYYQLLALKTAEKVHDTSIQLCQVNSTLGALYSRSAQYEKSLQYYKNALAVAVKYNDRKAIALSIFSVAKTYSWLKQPAAILGFLSSLSPQLLQTNENAEAAFIDMSFMEGYLGTVQLQKAGDYCDNLLRLYDDPAINTAVKSMINRLAASYYFGIKSFSKTRFYIERNAPITKTLPGTKWLSLDEKIWYRLDSAEGNYVSAFHHLLTYKTMTDSLLNETKAQQLQQLEVEYETAKKEDSLKQKDQHINVLQQRNDLQQTNLKQANLIKNITIGGAILAVIAFCLLYYQFSVNRKKNKIILQTNEALKDMLAEKEWWLKEVHHRVKNNLHTIICLLESQAMYLEKDALQAIEKSQHRIYAMSLIHQKLYQDEDLQVIDMSVYLEEFIGYLKDSFDTAHIEFIIAVEPVQLNLQQAIPVALIINEAVTNAIKYAFGNESNAKIRIAMSETDAIVTLAVTDNGKGFDPGEQQEEKGLGMQLIKGLGKELRGTVLINATTGTSLIITFKRDQVTNKIPALQEDTLRS